MSYYVYAIVHDVRVLIGVYNSSNQAEEKAQLMRRKNPYRKYIVTRSWSGVF